MTHPLSSAYHSGAAVSTQTNRCQHNALPRSVSTSHTTHLLMRRTCLCTRPLVRPSLAPWAPPLPPQSPVLHDPRPCPASSNLVAAMPFSASPHLSSSSARSPADCPASPVPTALRLVALPAATRAAFLPAYWLRTLPPPLRHQARRLLVNDDGRCADGAVVQAVEQSDYLDSLPLYRSLRPHARSTATFRQREGCAAMAE